MSTPWSPPSQPRSTSCRTRTAAARAARARSRALVLALHRLVLREAHVGVRQFRLAFVPAADRVLHEVLVVADREVVRPRVRAAALLARDARLEHAAGEVDHVPELDRLR